MMLDEVNDKKTSKIVPIVEKLLSFFGIAECPSWFRDLQNDRLRCTLLVGISVLLLLFIGAFAAAVSSFCKTIFNPSNINLGIGALITAVLSAPFLLWNTVIRQQSLEFQKEGHITDRISKAVEQLGTEKTVKVDGDEKTVPNIEVRIGGLLSLERIAQDSTRYDQGRDHVRVMEIICAYIRENAPASDAIDFPEPEWEPLKTDATKKEREAHIQARQKRFDWPNKASEWVRTLPPPRQDVQTALDVLGRRTAQQRRIEANWPEAGPHTNGWVFDEVCIEHLPDDPIEQHIPPETLRLFKLKVFDWQTEFRSFSGYRLNLRETNLQKADLSQFILSGSNLTDARLEGANLIGARLEGANLIHATMHGANLSGASLSIARLHLAKLEGARLEDTNLVGAGLNSTFLAGASLGNARLEGAELRHATLAGAFFWNSRLESSSLCGANLEGATFGYVRLDGADLNQTSFPDSRLQSADFSHADVSHEQLILAFGNASVTLPGNVIPTETNWPPHWPVWKLPLQGENSYDAEYQKWLVDPAGYTPPPPPNSN